MARITKRKLKLLENIDGIDASNLMTVSDYADKIKKTVARVHQLIDEKKIRAGKKGDAILIILE